LWRLWQRRLIENCLTFAWSGLMKILSPLLRLFAATQAHR
jgi:hypothetical protein